MKKVLIFLLATVLFLIPTAGYALEVDDETAGIHFLLSDDWINYSEGGEILFQHSIGTDEWMYISYFDADEAYSMEFIEEATLKQMCDEMFSDQQISEALSAENGAPVSVSSDSVVTGYEAYGGVTYYRYEKAVTARANGFYDTPFYYTVLTTPKNGRLYSIIYQRNYEENHFADVVEMLNSLSYTNGEIKILIDGQRIYSDSAPIMINNRTLVPIRAVAEAMNYTVTWNEEAQSVTLTENQGSRTLHFAIGNSVALKNLTQEIALDVPAIILGERTYLPLRAVTEAMDALVNWDDAARAVLIQSPSSL